MKRRAGHDGTWMERLVARLWADDRGADLVEYVVLAALFAVVLGIAMSGLDERVGNSFDSTTDDLTVPVSSPD